MTDAYNSPNASSASSELPHVPRRAPPQPPAETDAPPARPAAASSPVKKTAAEHTPQGAGAPSRKAVAAKPAAPVARTAPAAPRTAKPAADPAAAAARKSAAAVTAAAPVGKARIAPLAPAAVAPLVSAAKPRAARSVAADPAAAPRRKASPRVNKPLIVSPEVPTVVPMARQGPPRRTTPSQTAGVPPVALARPPLVKPVRDTLLLVAIGISVAVHAVVLAIHFKPFQAKKTDDKGPPIEVALVNAKTVARPTKADVLAQANLDGGGNTDENRRAKTPLPVLPKPAADQQIAVATQRVEELEEKTRELLTALKSIPVPQPQQAPTEVHEKTDLPTASELMQRTLESMRLEAQIAKDMDAYQKRPKRRFVGARAEEYRFARYVEDWRLKIERVGNMNYPEAARQQKLYGSLLLSVSIRSDGTLENVEIVRTSGSRILDAAAVKIVQMSGPFAPFPPDVKRDTDVLAITRTWTFTKADSLESK